MSSMTITAFIGWYNSQKVGHENELAYVSQVCDIRMKE
jgi:hypothetical protein